MRERDQGEGLGRRRMYDMKSLISMYEHIKVIAGEREKGKNSRSSVFGLFPQEISIVGGQLTFSNA